jgi:hypothetical protein
VDRLHSNVGLVASSEQDAALLQVRTHVVEEHPPPGAPGLRTFVVDLRARRSVPAHGLWPRVVSWRPSRIRAVEEDPSPSLVRFEVGRPYCVVGRDPMTEQGAGFFGLRLSGAEGEPYGGRSPAAPRNR